eukprot:6069219-Prymnesium_polylepis.2
MLLSVGRTCAQGTGPSSGVAEGCSRRNVPGKPLQNVSGAAAVPGPGSVGSRTCVQNCAWITL